jgi:hypothetical protein
MNRKLKIYYLISFLISLSVVAQTQYFPNAPADIAKVKEVSQGMTLVNWIVTILLSAFGLHAFVAGSNHLRKKEMQDAGLNYFAAIIAGVATAYYVKA